MMTETVRVPTVAFARALQNLDKIEALTLIRATFNCPLSEAQALYSILSVPCPVVAPMSYLRAAARLMLNR